MSADTDGWRPRLTPDGLRRRAEALAAVRAFFDARGVLEVDTPVLARFGVTDPQLQNLTTRTSDGRLHHLQTSPEAAMKRCLAAGSGPIYQLGPAFRDGESGRRHSAEFTLLEWYRPDIDPSGLMDEITALIAQLSGTTPPEQRVAYADAFLAACGVPHDAPTSDLRRVGEPLLGALARTLDHAELCDALFSMQVQPALGEGLVYVTGYPAEQAAMATLDPAQPSRSTRFELFWSGLELANGWQELADPVEQRQRFEADCARRRDKGWPEPALDTPLLAALASGLPACSGVALGLDRLFMRLWGAESLADVRPFGQT